MVMITVSDLTQAAKMTMNNSLLNIGLGIAGNAASAYSAGVDKADAKQEEKLLRQERRQAAALKQREGMYRLAEMGRTDALQSSTQPQQVELLQAQLQQQSDTIRRTENKVRKTELFDTLRIVFDSGSPEAFNRYLQDNIDNPKVQAQFKGTVRLDKLDLQSDNDRQLLLGSGITQDELDRLDGNQDGSVDWTKLQSRFFKSVDNRGKVEIKDMLRTASALGYSKYADEQTLSRMERLADISKKQKTSEPRLSFMQMDALAVGEAKARIDAGKPQVGDKELVERHANEVGGTSSGKRLMAQDAITAWDEAGFDSMSQAELQESTEARKYIRAIELDNPLSNADEKDIKDLASMVALIEEAGSLSEEQTGLLDSMTSNLTSYVSDSTITKQAKSSYMALINTFRHSLFGSALTEGELKAFADAYGTNRQQLGPILAGMRSMALQIDSKLTTISNLNNDKVVKFRLGKTVEDMTRAKAGIELRLEFLNLLESGMSVEEAAEAVNKSGTGTDYMERDVTPNPRAEVDESNTNPADYTVLDVEKALGL